MINEELERAIDLEDFKRDKLKDDLHDLYEENKQLKERIDKAIEYINNASYFDGSSMCANDLLKILGSDNNE